MAATRTMRTEPSATAEQRAAIVAADDLFSVHGVGPVSVHQIAAAAHLSPSDLRTAFPDEHDLVLAALGRRHRIWFDALHAATTGHDDPRDALLAVFTYLETTFDDATFRGCAFINGYGELGRQDVDVARLADEHLSRTEQHIAMLCEHAAMPPHIGAALTLLIQGAHVEASIHHTAAPARTARLAAATLMSIYETRDDWS